MWNVYVFMFLLICKLLLHLVSNVTLALSLNFVKHCALVEFRSFGFCCFIYGIFWYVNSLQKMVIVITYPNKY